MQRKLLANAALCATIAEAINTKLLIQSMQANTSHSCGYSFDRLLNGTTNFYDLAKSSSDYTDTTFPTNDAVYFRDDAAEES